MFVAQRSDARPRRSLCSGTVAAKRVVAYEAIAREIHASILTGEFQPGARMPDEGELAERFAVGRSTIREALRVLGGRGYVRIASGAGGGAFVNAGDPVEIGRGFADDLEFLMGDESISLAELTEARQIQEISASRLAALRAGPAEVERIRELAERGLALLDDPDGFLEANLGFHMAISAATHNRVVHMWMSAIGQAVEGAMREASATPDIRRHVADQHVAIADAIGRRDADTAGDLMRVHIDDFCTDLALGSVDGPAARDRARRRSA
jgi:GntR family transcriptional regulator, transcriptional repressor for pyruvate dehydrogenase complex